MIEVKNVEKSFGESKVLKGITTTFETGKTNLIIGQSGSGKTVFPEPLCPMIRLVIPASKRVETPFKTVCSPNFFTMFFTSIISSKGVGLI